jgi:hypothetical protein
MAILSQTYDKSYTIADPLMTWSLDGTALTTQVPACGYSQTLSVTKIPIFVSATYAQPSVAFSVTSRDLAEVGVYTIEVTSTLIGYTFTTPKVAPTSTGTFTFTAVNPCLTTVLSNVPSAVENFVAFAG